LVLFRVKPDARPENPQIKVISAFIFKKKRMSEKIISPIQGRIAKICKNSGKKPFAAGSKKIPDGIPSGYP
jgi:hypothetical protein